MSKRFFVFVLFLIVGLLGGLAWFQLVFLPEMIRTAIQSSPPPVVTVSAEAAKTERWTPKLRAIGTLKAETGIDVTTQAAGIAKTIAFSSGDDVKQGALLVQLDDNVEQADLQSAQATLKNAESDLARQQDLFRRGTVAQSQLDQAIAKRDETAAAVDKIRATIAQKRITAPFDGKLGIRRVDVGQYVSPGQPLVPLQSLDDIVVDFPLPEQDISRVKVGQTVELRVDAWPGEVFSGTIDAVDARVNQETRTIVVRGRIANPDRRLLPGMFANLEVLAGEPQDVVTVPRTAITYSLYGDSIYVVKPAPKSAEPTPAGRHVVNLGRTGSRRDADGARGQGTPARRRAPLRQGGRHPRRPRRHQRGPEGRRRGCHRRPAQAVSGCAGAHRQLQHSRRPGRAAGDLSRQSGDRQR